MSPTDPRDTLLSGPGIRVRPEMMEYILGRVGADAVAPIPVIAYDARTGSPIETALSPEAWALELKSLAASTVF